MFARGPQPVIEQRARRTGIHLQRARADAWNEVARLADDKPWLLVLDNLEHLPDTSFIGELVATAPPLRTRGLRGGLLSWDGQPEDDARLAPAYTVDDDSADDDDWRLLHRLAVVESRRTLVMAAGGAEEARRYGAMALIVPALLPPPAPRVTASHIAGVNCSTSSSLKYSSRSRS